MDNTNWQRRALAAEKTVDILKTKVIDLYDRGPQTAIHRQLAKAQERQERNRQRQAMMQLRADELEKYSAKLEGDVKARTRQIQVILDNVAFGFLVVDRDLQVQQGFSDFCHDLLGKDEIAGQSLGDLLDLDESASGSLWLGVDQVFEDLMPEEVTLGQIPARFVMGERVIKAEFRAIREEGGTEVIGLLVTLSDNTHLEDVERQNALNQALLRIVRQKAAFMSFLAESRELIELCRGSLSDQASVRRYVHTLKGNSAIFGVDSLATLIHAEEEAERLHAEAIDRIEAGFAGFLQQHHGVLGVAWSDVGVQRYEVDADGFGELVHLANTASPVAGARVGRWVAEHTSVPAADVLGPLDSFVERLGARLGKPVRFELSGASVPVHGDTVRPVTRTLAHLLRNAVDHGIEAPGLRGDKAECGTVGISVAEDEDSYSIEVWDDGGGIDVDTVVEHAIAKGAVLAADVASWDDDARLKLIFADGVSSATEATEISGRGVGMSAVLSAVRTAGGTLDVFTSLGEGSHFVLRIPKPSVLCVPVSLAS